MKSDQIRYIYEYFPYAGEDPTIENSVHKYGTTTAEFIEEAFITNAIIDANGNNAFFIIFNNSLYSKFISFFNFLNDIVNDILVPIIVEIIAP